MGVFLKETLSRRDDAKIARRFNAGKRVHLMQVPQGRLRTLRERFRIQSSLQDLLCVIRGPGVETPGYSQSFLRNESRSK